MKSLIENAAFWSSFILAEFNSFSLLNKKLPKTNLIQNWSLIYCGSIFLKVFVPTEFLKYIPLLAKYRFYFVFLWSLFVFKECCLLKGFQKVFEINFCK